MRAAGSSLGQGPSFCAARAAVTAASTSAGPAMGAVAMTAPVWGEITSSDSAEVGACHEPPTYSWVRASTKPPRPGLAGPGPESTLHDLEIGILMSIQGGQASVAGTAVAGPGPVARITLLGQ